MMRHSLLTLAALVVTVFLTARGVSALPSTGMQSLRSSDGRFEAALSDAADQLPRWQSSCWLTITDHGRQIARYHFEGELISGYWSPGGHYLAIDNHYGHRAWAIWVVSLRTGAIIRADGTTTRASAYDAYSDEHKLPDVYQAAKGILRRLNLDSDDYFRGGPISVAYGWKNARELRMFHEYISDQQAERENAGIWLTNTLKVSGAGLQIKNLKGKKVKLQEAYPAPVRSVLDWMSAPAPAYDHASRPSSNHAIQRTLASSRR